jgi:hypothetical protein
MQQMLVPLPWRGNSSQAHITNMSWINDLSQKVYLALWQRWPDQDLPVGYDAYLVSFHLEAVDVEWLDRQCRCVDAPIIVLFDGSYYDYPCARNLYPITYLYWHHQLDLMLNWFGKSTYHKEKTHKVSAVCSRITQSKLLSFTAIAEYIGSDHALLVLSDWLEEKNVHHRLPTGNKILDSLSNIFWTKYYGTEFKIDDYRQDLNFQRHTANFHHTLYQKAAIHFTNESYHYSLMNGHRRPGPFITEKTLKPLAAGQPFIPVGQFDTYGTLSRLGFQFEYEFDTSWDLDPGNLSRLENIIKLIKELSNWSVSDIEEATKKSTIHNLEHINSGDFAKMCEKHNQNSVNQILDLLQ